jgi:hypothetical protein
MDKHKVKVTLSTEYSETVDANCTCGWFFSLGTYSVHSKSMRVVRQELRYHVTDHLNGEHYLDDYFKAEANKVVAA